MLFTTAPVLGSTICQEKKEAAQWEVGTKGKSAKDEKEEKRKAELARKAENARLLAEEEAAAQQVKVKAKAGKKSPSKPAGPGAIAAGGELDSEKGKEKETEIEPGEPTEVESYAATGIDNALDLLDLVTAKMDKASIGQQAAGIEKHPEVRLSSVILKVFSYSLDARCSGGSRLVAMLLDLSYCTELFTAI
jgi:hypothetical protein